MPERDENMEVTFSGAAETLRWQGPLRSFFEDHWEALSREWPKTVPEHLTWEFYERRQAAFAGRTALLDRVCSLCRKLPSLPEVCFYGWAVPYLDYVLRVSEPPAGGLVFPTEIFGEDTPVFFLMIKAGLIPALRRIYEKRGIPAGYAESYIHTLLGISDMYAAGHDGKPGVWLRLPSWERAYANLKIFRIGRLAVEFCHYYLPFLPAVWRAKSGGGLTVFCQSGWLLDPQGRMPCSGGPEPADVRTVRLIEDADRITGVPIDPQGHCDPAKTRTLRRSEWEPVCAPWDLIANLHIPGGEPLTPDAVRGSLMETCEFARTYLHQEVALFCCNSWILNPAWERELPHSNLTKFQQEFWLAPGSSTGTDGLKFVYGNGNADPVKRPAGTALHRAFRHLIESGEKLRSGTGFLLPEHLRYYGSQYYRCGSIRKTIEQPQEDFA